jgi:hypothetical protein
MQNNVHSADACKIILKIESPKLAGGKYIANTWTWTIPYQSGLVRTGNKQLQVWIRKGE